MANEIALRYDVKVDPSEETSHGKLVRYTGRNKTVLDLGCATGGVARALVDWGCTVYGFELDPEAAVLAESVCKRVVVGDLDTVDLTREFKAERFDVVLAGDVLEHVMDPARVLRQAKALLADDGYVVVSVPNMAHGSVRLALLHGDLPPSDTGLLDRTHIQYLTRSSFTKLLEDAGFAVAIMDGTVQRIADSEVPYPADSLTDLVLAQLEVQPDAHIYQYVAIAYPGAKEDLPPVAALVNGLSEDLTRSRANAVAWESRAYAAEAGSELLRAELGRRDGREAELLADREAAVSAGLAPLRQELLVARDQLMHRDHDVKRVIDLYEQHTVALRDSEADRQRLHGEIVRSHDESALLLAELQATQATRTWRVGQKLAVIARGRLSRSPQ